jgi:hypothetical protein
MIITLGVLMLAGRAHASIGRTQGFEIGALNRVEWAGGIGSVQGDNQASFTQKQEFSDRRTGVSAVQTGRGSLVQTATAGGTGSGTARQTASLSGSQNLPADFHRHVPGRIQQDLGLKLGTHLFKPNGVGTVGGTQTYTGAQEQTVTTPTTTSGQSQSVDIRQSGAITTGTDTDPTVKNKITVDLHQSQAMNAR